MVQIAIPYAYGRTILCVYTRKVCTIHVRYEIRVWYTTFSFACEVHHRSIISKFDSFACEFHGTIYDM